MCSFTGKVLLKLPTLRPAAHPIGHPGQASRAVFFFGQDFWIKTVQPSSRSLKIYTFTYTKLYSGISHYRRHAPAGQYAQPICTPSHRVHAHVERGAADLVTL